MTINRVLLNVLNLLFLIALSTIKFSQVCSQPFSPLTANLNFRAYYRVQPFAQASPLSLSDVYESYHSSLATGLIRHTVQEGSASASEGVTKYLYDSKAKRVIQFNRGKQELDDGDELFHDDFYLFENGCANSYQSYRVGGDASNDEACQNNHYESIKLLPTSPNLDSKLLLAGADDNLPLLNLDHFMSDDCLTFLNAKLHYINGVTKLLHLIECRRAEFLLQTNKKTPEARAQRGNQYRAAKLEPVATQVSARRAIASLDISVTVPASGGDTSITSKILDSGLIPLSIVVNFDPQVSILINVFQFESVGPDEHLSESADAHSSFLMPLAHPDLSNMLFSIQKDVRADEVDHSGERSFSFRGSLSGSLMSQVYGDPVEMAVSYDADLMTLSSEMSFIDRTNSDGLDGWSRSTVRQLLDGQSSLRFHSMDSNFGYRGPLGETEKSSNEPKSSRWRSCATNHLAASELNVLLTTGGDLFNLNGAIYMGMALVRGIACHVYERRLFKMPTLLGLSEHDYAHWLESHQVYLNSYVHFNEASSVRSFGGKLTRPEVKFVRLQLKLVSLKDKNSISLSFVLDLNSFDWRPHDFIGDGSLSHRTIIQRMTQDCLLVVPGARHLDMELWFKKHDSTNQTYFGGGRYVKGPNVDQNKLLRELQLNKELRDQSVIGMLTKTLQISPVQQVDLTSKFLLSQGVSNDKIAAAAASRSKQANGGDWLLYVKFSLYELWNDFVEDDFIGYALDLSYNTRMAPTSPIYGTGARSYSYDECKWRTVHSLQPESFKSEYGRNNDDDESMMNSLRLFMFCPRRLICILGDASWLPMRNKRPLKLDNLLEFPYSRAAAVAATNDTSEGTQSAEKSDENKNRDVNKCLVSSVIIRQQSLLSKATAMNSRRSKLDWWLTNGRHGSKAASDEDENLAQLQVRELRFQLKVKVAQPTAAAAASAAGRRYKPTVDGMTNADDVDGDALVSVAADEQSRSLLMQVSKLRLSNKILISNAITQSNGGASDDDENDDGDGDGSKPSLLVKPLHGLAYLAASNGRGTPRQPAGNQNNGGDAGKNNGVIKPLIVSNLAECARVCLLAHGCQSFSACHQPIGAWTSPSGSANSAGRLAGGKISCVLSKLKWADSLEMNQLVRLARTGSRLNRSQKPQQQQQQKQQVSALTVRLGELAAGRQAEVFFEVSPLCSLHARPQLDLFRLRRSRIEVQPNARHLIYAKSVEQCARFCQERAELMRQLAGAAANSDSVTAASLQPAIGLTSASRTTGCYEFYYSADNQYCQLIPKADVWSALRVGHLLGGRSSAATAAATKRAPNDDDDDDKLCALANRSALVRRWLEWFQTRTPHARWLAKLLSVYGETQYYELDFEQIFLPHRNLRLTLAEPDEKANSSSPSSSSTTTALNGASSPFEADQTLQVRVSSDSSTGCAERCLKWKGCRSFGVQSRALDESGPAMRSFLCLLNAVSARELAADPARWPKLKLERTAADANSLTTWWHYEPSELALFMITDPDEPGLNLTGEQTGDDSDESVDAGVFIQPPGRW